MLEIFHILLASFFNHSGGKNAYIILCVQYSVYSKNRHLVTVLLTVGWSYIGTEATCSTVDGGQSTVDCWESMLLDSLSLLRYRPKYSVSETVMSVRPSVRRAAGEGAVPTPGRRDRRPHSRGDVPTPGWHPYPGVMAAYRRGAVATPGATSLPRGDGGVALGRPLQFVRAVVRAVLPRQQQSARQLRVRHLVAVSVAPSSLTRSDDECRDDGDQHRHDDAERREDGDERSAGQVAVAGVGRRPAALPADMVTRHAHRQRVTRHVLRADRCRRVRVVRRHAGCHRHVRRVEAVGAVLHARPCDVLLAPLAHWNTRRRHCTHTANGNKHGNYFC